MRVFITRTRTKVINSTAYQLNALVAVLPNLADFSINDNGVGTAGILRVYCSEQAHSSVEKAVKITMRSLHIGLERIR